MSKLSPSRSQPCTRRQFLAALSSTVATASLLPLSTAARASDELARELALDVSASDIANFQPGKTGATQFGKLEYRGGMALQSSFKHFGGLSGLLIAPDGKGLLAVTDVGNWLSAEIVYAEERPVALRNCLMGPLLDARGHPLRDKKQQDAESLTLLDGTLERGTVLVGFERRHRLTRYPVKGGKLLAPAGPEMVLIPEMKRMPDNQGFEAVAVLKGGPHKGALIAFAERFTRGSGYHTGWIWIGGEAKRLHLKDMDGFDITDAAGLDNGDLLVLERRFRWTEGVQMRVRRLRAAQIAPGARLSGEILIQADGDFQIDNMEGLSVHRDARGRQVLTMISDDNFNPLLQRTLLLQFTLDGAGRGTGP